MRQGAADAEVGAAKARSALSGVQLGELPRKRKVPHETTEAARLVASQFHLPRHGAGSPAAQEAATAAAQLAQLSSRLHDAEPGLPKRPSVEFVPPTLPGAGSPLGEKHRAGSSHDPRLEAQDVLLHGHDGHGDALHAQAEQDAAAKRQQSDAKRSERAAAGYADATRAMKSAMERKLRMGSATRSGEL